MSQPLRSTPRLGINENGRPAHQRRTTCTVARTPAPEEDHDGRRRRPVPLHRQPSPDHAPASERQRHIRVATRGTRRPPTKRLRADRTALAEQLVPDRGPGRTPPRGACGRALCVSRSAMRDKIGPAEVHPLHSDQRPNLRSGRLQPDESCDGPHSRYIPETIPVACTSIFFHNLMQQVDASKLVAAGSWLQQAGRLQQVGTTSRWVQRVRHGKPAGKVPRRPVRRGEGTRRRRGPREGTGGQSTSSHVREKN